MRKQLDSDRTARAASIRSTALAASVVVAGASLLFLKCEKDDYEFRLAYYFTDYQEVGRSSGQHGAYVAGLAKEIVARGQPEVARVLRLCIGFSWRYKDGEAEYELACALGKPAADEAIHILRSSDLSVGQLSEEEQYCLSILQCIANHRIRVPLHLANHVGGRWIMTLDPGEKEALIRAWIKWWEEHESQTEPEWYIEQLLDPDEDARRFAIRNLKNMYGIDLDYKPDAPESDRKRIQAEWRRRWRSLSAR